MTRVYRKCAKGVCKILSGTRDILGQRQRVHFTPQNQLAIDDNKNRYEYWVLTYISIVGEENLKSKDKFQISKHKIQILPFWVFWRDKFVFQNTETPELQNYRRQLRTKNSKICVLKQKISFWNTTLWFEMWNLSFDFKIPTTDGQFWGYDLALLLTRFPMTRDEGPPQANCVFLYELVHQNWWFSLQNLSFLSFLLMYFWSNLMKNVQIDERFRNIILSKHSFFEKKKFSIKIIFVLKIWCITTPHHSIRNVHRSRWEK